MKSGLRNKITCCFLGAGLSPVEVRTGYEGTEPENWTFSGLREVVLGLVRYVRPEYGRTQLESVGFLA